MSQLDSALLADWNRAEQAIKHAELARSDIVMSAIIELRHAGRRVVEAIASESDSERTALLEEARLYCQRATQDALDAEALYWIALFDRQRRSVPDAFAQELQGLIIKISHEISQSREDRSLRTARYESIANELSRIASIARNVELKSEEGNRLTVFGSFSSHWIDVIALVLGFALSVGVDSRFDFVQKLFQLLR